MNCRQTRRFDLIAFLFGEFFSRNLLFPRDEGRVDRQTGTGVFSAAWTPFFDIAVAAPFPQIPTSNVDVIEADTEKKFDF
jgi:hypothetical protein